MTHPDDEISICAWIKRLAQNGNPVYLNWTHSNPIREAEAIEVAGKLGVPKANLSFMGATDGNIRFEMAELLPKFQDLLDRVRPDRVACGAFEQGHLDHDATNWLVNRAFHGPVYEIPFYHPYTRKVQKMNQFAIPVGQESLWLSAEEWRLKLDVARSYKSQNIWRVLWWYEAWQTVRFKKAELRKRELMRLQVHKDFRTPNLPRKLRREVEASDPWRSWIHAIDRANMSL